jgi:hypothetical protein
MCKNPRLNMKRKTELFESGVLVNGGLRKKLTIEEWAAKKIEELEKQFELPAKSVYIEKIEKIGRYYFVHYNLKT